MVAKQSYIETELLLQLSTGEKRALHILYKLEKEKLNEHEAG
ncbi:hypothetical protein FLA_3961 [Filimonas lacunae]|nr:hypothetical protein FLA_3961 [Filimonas lacunae]